MFNMSRLCAPSDTAGPAAPTSLRELIEAHDCAASALWQAIDDADEIEAKLRTKLGLKKMLVPLTLLGGVQVPNRSYHQASLRYPEESTPFAQAHRELRERLCPEWMRTALPDHHAAVSAALDESEARVLRIYKMKLAFLEKCKRSAGLSAAIERVNAAVAAEVRAKLAVLLHQPSDAAEAKIKAEHLDLDDMADDKSFLEALLRHFMPAQEHSRDGGDND